MNKQIRKMLTASGGPIYEKDWSDRWEPHAAKIGLAGDAIGLGAAVTGVGVPIGSAIAGFANIPNLIIDGYQTARDTWRSFNDNGNNLGSAAWNGGELILDAAGLKALQYINKAAKAGVASEKYLTSTEKALDSKPWKRVGTGHGRVRARQRADHKRKYNSRRNKALEESNIELAKRGVRPTLGLYYQQKLTDEMAKRGYGVAVNDAIKSANRTLRQNLATISTISGGTNIYHLLPKRKNGGLIRKMQTAAGGPIHYSRTMTPDNLSKAANYVGEYVLKGLGAFGKIMTAPFVQLGPTSATIYKSKKLLAKEKAIELKSEELLGKAMTWISPLNYSAALATGNGLNAKKGEEEVASWSPALQAVGRLGELYVGPKAVKGIKATPRVVINTAAKAGVKPAKTSSTIQISPEELYKVLKDQELNGYYFMGHGTGRTNVNPLVIFDNGLRIKNGDIGNTTSPISLSSLSLWPHANSKEVIILPGKAENVRFDSAHGRIPSDWYSSKTFQWDDNPGFEGSGFFSVLKPNATFVETEINGVPGVYTKPEAVLGSYNIDTHTLKLNPRSLYEFLFNVPKLTESSKNNIVGTSLDYSMKNSKGVDFIKQFFALLKINGKEYTLEGLKDAANVQQGLPEYILSYLNLNTIERAVRAMRKNGYSERQILLYIDKTNEVMNKVKVGMYSDLEYNAAGALDFGGFYNDDTNFISINKDAYLTKPAFTPNYIMKHEGRHLIDYNTSMTDDVINTLEKAYDKDFLEIPKHEDAGSLKNYLHMDRERVTTNRDAREVFLSNLEKHPGEFLNKNKFSQTSFGKNKDMIDFLNELILYAEPEDIINAVENSNGYGKRYINYLRNNNKLTSAKIELLRLAMIHVPSYLLPVAGGYALYNIFNQPQLQYLKQGGKMNILELLKNGSGIHIKKKNRGSFTRWCGGNVTEECIRRGKASSNPKIRKKATFADNARHFKHRSGGLIVQEFKLRKMLNNIINK